MRTKTLLCLTAMAVGAVSAMAQSNVYSLNVVGYINITIPAQQYVMLANQLNTTNNSIGSLLPTAPAGAILQKFSGTYSAYSYDDLSAAWLPDGNATLNPGEGAFFKSPVATTLTFVGEVIQGWTTNTLPVGQYAIRSSIVPQAATPTVFQIPAEAGDILQLFNNGYTAYSYDDLSAAWLPSEPTIPVGASFFYKKSPTGTQPNWVRNFTVQ